MSANCSKDLFSTPIQARIQSLPVITARPSRDEKDQFAKLAASRGISESTLAMIAIRALLASNGTPTVAALPERAPASDRLTIRLRPGDRQEIRRRAAGRRMKDAGYLAALVRAHVGADPPLPTHELMVLKATVASLAAFGRAWAIRTRHGAVRLPSDVQADVREMRALLARLEQDFRQFTRAAILAWEAPHG